MQIPCDHQESIVGTSFNSPQVCKVDAKLTIVTNIGGDGNCFFRCLSFLITNTEENHAVLRQLTVQAIQQSHLHSATQTVEEYIQLTKVDSVNVWSTEVEVLAAASLLQTDIYTYALHGHCWKWLRYPACGNLDTPVDITKRAIYLSKY